MNAISWPANGDKLIAKSLDAARAFYREITTAGGTIEEEYWLGNKNPHRITCPAGHSTAVLPHSIQIGHGMCRFCQHAWRKDRAAQAFWDAIERLGGKVEEESWLGSDVPHRITCPAGHSSAVRPNCIQNGQGMCRFCQHAGRKDRAAQAFWDAIERPGGAVNETQWLGSGVLHRITCPVGHQTTVQPSCIQQGQGMCHICADGSDLTAKKFWEFVESRGGIVREPSWLGSHHKHKITCPHGHETSIYPISVLYNGQGICGQCWIQHDVFYVVSRPDHSVKFGVTSGNPKARLNFHSSWGYFTTEFLVTGLPVGVADETEKKVIAELAAAGFKPEMGREYFGPEAYDVVLELARKFLGDGVGA